MNSLEFRKYLSLLQEISGTLAKLASVQQEKARAVRLDDLRGLDVCMKQEQAIGMTLRGCEQKRVASLASLGLQGSNLGALCDLAPEDCRREALETVEELNLQYRYYRSASEVARNTLECNLHEIEKVLKDLGKSMEDGVEIPGTLHRDFRA